MDDSTTHGRQFSASRVTAASCSGATVIPTTPV
jgi:hypothetical protein